jgi:beta-glucosidase
MKNLNALIPPGKALAGLTCLILTGLLSTGVFAQADEIVFSNAGGSPWQLYLGSNANWMVPVQGPETTSYKSKVVTVRTIDNLATADAVQAEWKAGLGQVYWQQADPQDYRELAAQGGALSMVIRIDKRPKKSVDLKMDCGYPCAGTLNMTKLFKTVPQDTWFRVSLKLSCFEAAGANLGNILAPLVVATTGSFKLSISDVRLLADPPQESLVDCG